MVGLLFPLFYQNRRGKSMARKAARNAQGGGTIRQRPDGRWEAGRAAPRPQAHGGDCSHCQRRGYQIGAGPVRPRYRQLYAERLRPHLGADDERHGGTYAELL